MAYKLIGPINIEAARKCGFSSTAENLLLASQTKWQRIGRISVRCWTRCLEAAALINGTGNDHGALAHRLQHGAANKFRRARARNEYRTNDNVVSLRRGPPRGLMGDEDIGVLLPYRYAEVFRT